MVELLSPESAIYPQFLAQRFPHILQRMTALWGTPDIEGYLTGLLAPVRSGAVGFPEEALIEIQAIKVACCGEDQVVETQQEDEPAPLRKALLTFLDDDRELFPKTLEAQFPQLIKEIVSRLGQAQTDDYFANLLAVRKQAEYGFSEDALVEIFTIRAYHRAKYPNYGSLSNTNSGHTRLPDSQTKAIGDQHEEASMVFDRIHRW